MGRSRSFIVLLSILLIFSAAASLPAQSAAATPADTVKISYQEVYDYFTNLEIDPGQVAEIKEPFALTRDVGNFVLQKGKLFLCQPFQERVCAALFLGEGNFSFTPPTAVEKKQLYRFYDRETLEEKFSALFLIFADSTLDEMQKNFSFAPGRVPPEAKDLVDYALNYLSQKKGKQFDHQILKTFLDGDYNGFFYAHFSKNKTEPLFFEINPFSEEEVRFMRRLKGPSFYYFPELINQFHLQSEYAGDGPLREEQKNALHVKKYVIDCTLKGSSLKFSAAAELEFESLKNSQNWLYFIMFEELEVDSLFWDDGSKAIFVKEKDSPFLWVKCLYPLRKGQVRKLKAYYQGKLIERQNDWFYIRSPRSWYPRDDGYRTAAEFDVTYHTPKNFQFAAAGKLLSQQAEGDMITSRWVSGRPVSNTSFNVGFFEEHNIRSDSIPPVTVYMSKTGHLEIAHQLALQGIGSGTNMIQKVGKDVANSLEFFQSTFGKVEEEHFYATEIPYAHGEAFPGLIHLTWRTFQLESEEGDDEIFRAHEAAHQWWGIGVDFKTYHDQWLSEAFSEYCGWWYLHEVVKKEEKDEKKFYKMLENRRKEITGNRDYFIGRGKKAGPIWLGYRTLSSDTEGDYRLIIYKKGAWVLHMLRSMYLNLETGSDERFQALMRGFFQKYQNQKVSTEDFQAFAEENFREDLDWFFQQWVYGMDFPEYTFSYAVNPTAGGQFQVLGRVRQTQETEHFQMPVILGIDFGNGEITAERVWIKGPVTEFELGAYAREPRKVIFNHLESVLCEAKEEKWQ